jgi:hypothetical protein
MQIFTHVISSIIHIDHEYFDDNHPWPIEIEDHDGNLHAVNLEPGQVSCRPFRLSGQRGVQNDTPFFASYLCLQMLFYESAACLHGRRQVFKGKYYASVFSHYQPVDRTIWNFTTEVRHMYVWGCSPAPLLLT